METLAAQLQPYFDGPMLPIGMGVMAAMIAIGSLWSIFADRLAVRRRAKSVGFDTGPVAAAGRDPAASQRAEAARLLAYVSRYFVPDDKQAVAVLRRRLIQAGFLKPTAVAAFFMVRGLGALLLSLLTFVGLPVIMPEIVAPRHYIAVGVAMVLGYVGPSLWLDRRIKANAKAHRFGFPDFMDLMVVCADSGLSMEAALERVGREMAATHPSLSANLSMATLEMRAGRTLGEALDHLGDRLGIEEAQAFATLLQQSQELGSSMTDALRVYSDDMRHQRMMRAEEKAYALPAKLVIPLGLFIFPIVMLVALLPVIIRLKFGMMGAE